MSRQKGFRVATGIDAPIETVWRAVTDLDRTRQWFGWEHSDLDDEITEIFHNGADTGPGHRIGLPVDQELIVSGDGADTTIAVTMPGARLDTEQDEAYDPMEEGWRAFFAQLKFYLERWPQGHRRTLFFTGAAAGTDLTRLIDGRTWLTARFQHMVVVDGHLVGVGARTPLSGSDPGSASLIVSGYDLDDTQFDRLREHWTGRWNSVATDVKLVV